MPSSSNPLACSWLWETAFTGSGGNVQWQDLLQACLYEPHQKDGDKQAHPLAVALFLLDGISVLQILSPKRDGLEHEYPFAASETADDETKAMARSELIEHFQIYLSELVGSHLKSDP